MDPSTFFTDSYRGLEAFAKRLSDIYMTAKVSQPRDKLANTHANKMNFHIRRDQVTFVVASNFNSEIHAMFYGRILPSLHTFPRGSDFCLKGLLFAFKFSSPLRDVSRLCDVSIFASVENDPW